MKFHQVAELFPLMSSDEFAGLCADVAANGLREAIWTHDGKIIDGRNRYRACISTKTEPRFRAWDGTGSLLAFVVSLNLNRRHLSESQRAMVAGKLANLDRTGRPLSDTQICEPVSQADAAQMLNVSARLVSSARKVTNDGVPELVEMVEDGRMKVSRAAQIAELPKGKQKRIIKRGRNAGRELLNKLKAKSLETSLRPGSGCLHCDPAASFTDKSVSAHLQHLAAKSATFARYFNAIVEEIEESSLSDETQDAREVILDAIDHGYQEEAQIGKRTGLARDLVKHTLAVMLDYDVIESFQQGGKTDVARGARKVLYRRSARAADTDVDFDYYEQLAREDALHALDL